MQAPTPVQSQPSQLQLNKYLLAWHAGSVLCIASTNFCFPDITALQSNPNLPGRDFFFPTDATLLLREGAGRDGWTDRQTGGERWMMS